MANSGWPIANGRWQEVGEDQNQIQCLFLLSAICHQLLAPILGAISYMLSAIGS